MMEKHNFLSKENKIKTGIKQWAEDDRPREKMLLKGASSLSDAELIAILLNSGSAEKSAVDVAREILGMAGNNLSKLARMDIKDFQQVKGVGPAKAITLMAALELGRRRQSGGVLNEPQIKSSRDLAAIIIPMLQDLNHEVFYVFYLNRANKIIHQETVSHGGTTATIADIKIIMRHATSHLAESICVAHNHPSGNIQPSEADKNLTQKLKAAADLLDMKLIDHIIVGHQDYFSFSDAGLL